MQAYPVVVVDGLEAYLGTCEPNALIEYFPMPMCMNLDLDLLFHLLDTNSIANSHAFNDCERDARDLYTFIGNHMQQIKKRDATTIQDLQKFGIFRNTAEFNYTGVAGKALLDKYIYFSNGPENGGIQFASKRCQVRLFKDGVAIG